MKQNSGMGCAVKNPSYPAVLLMEIFLIEAAVCSTGRNMQESQGN